MTVQLPEGEDRSEWLAVHTVDFFNEVNLLFSLLEEELDEKRFPSMTAGDKYEYLWQDGDKYKKPTRVPAKEYIQLLLEWIDRRVNDEAVFPVSTDRSFPSDFEDTVRTIFRRMFRVYAHIYYHHWEKMRELGVRRTVDTMAV